MAEIRHGHVVLYSYLWARERDRGEESGRKVRPACVMLIVAGRAGRQRTLLFPVTSRPPGQETHAVPVPEIEAVRVKLATPAWVIVDEFNTDDLETSFALEDRQPLGLFSRRFMARIAQAAAVAIRAGSARGVSRR